MCVSSALSTLLQHTELLPKLPKVGSTGSLASADSASSRHSMQHGGEPELMLGLTYNELTGRLSVEVIKGSNFKNLATSKPPGVLLSCSSLHQVRYQSWPVKQKTKVGK